MDNNIVIKKFFINESSDNSNLCHYFLDLGHINTSLQNFLSVPNLTGSICVYNIDEKFSVQLPKDTINIFIISKPIVNISNIMNYTYYLPTNISLFMTYKHKFNLKVMFPINKIINEYSCSDILYNKIKKKIKYAKFNKNADIFIYESVKDFDNLKQRGLIMNSKEIHCINNICSLINTIGQQSFLENIPIVNVNIDYNNPKLNLEKNTKVLIIRKNSNIICPANFFNLIHTNTAFLVKNNCGFEIAIIYYVKKTRVVDYFDLISEINYLDDRILGTNTEELDNTTVFNLYYYFGKNNIFTVYKSLSLVESYYYEAVINFVLNIETTYQQKFNENKFRRIIAYWGGINNYKLDIDDIDRYIDKNKELFDQEKILLISKNLIDYGGNQKTAIQLYNELITSGYDVKIICLTRDELVDAIDGPDILQIYKLNQITDMINKTNNTFKLVIVNKLDEYFKIINDVKCKSIFITHNSMDPVNSEIIKYPSLKKILTVNDYHGKLLYANGAKCKIDKYINYINNNIGQICNRNKMKNNIVCVGRICREKNIDMLIDSFSDFLSDNPDKLLYILGDGKNTINNINENIIFVGRCNNDKIAYYLANCDYLIVPSMTEGLPFVILEAMNIGIPVISSNIVGVNEIVVNEQNGFLFDYKDYYKYKNILDNWSVMDYVYENKNILKHELTTTLNKAYSISVDKWNDMSNKCKETMQKYYSPEQSKKQNIEMIFNSNIILLIEPSNENQFTTIKNIFNVVSNLDTDQNKQTNIQKNNVLIKICKFNINIQIAPNIFAAKVHSIVSEMTQKEINIIHDDDNFIKINNYTKNIKIKSVTDLLFH